MTAIQILTCLLWYRVRQYHHRYSDATCFWQEGKEAQANAEEDQNVWAHCQVMWGNLIYELSQMKAAVGEPWKPLLDEATNKFRIAGCPEADIRGALSGHTMKDEIELGPEPEAKKVRAKSLPL